MAPGIPGVSFCVGPAVHEGVSSPYFRQGEENNMRLSSIIGVGVPDVLDLKLKERKKRKKKKIGCSHLAGLEPATFRLTAERANRLRHKCLLMLRVALDDLYQ